MKIKFSEHELLISYIAKHPDFIPVLVDVGAHIGIVSTYFADLEWRVVAFEPEPSNHQRLKDAIGDNQNVTIIHKAVSDVENEKVDFYVSSRHYGIHSLQPFHETHTEKISVQTTRLDKALDLLELYRLGYLKIDIEGADFLALKSLDFEKLKPQLIMVEFMDSRSLPNFGYTYHDMVAYLQQYGYQAWVCEWSEVQEYGVEGEKSGDYHFIQCVPYSAKVDIAWGNLIFLPEQDNALFQEVLETYLVGQTRHAKGMERRRIIENLPGGKTLYKFLKMIRNLG